MTKLRALLASLTLVAGATYWMTHDSQAASPSVTPGATLARPEVLVAPGVVEPARDRVVLSFETPGRIVAIDVDEGDPVVAGQPVARLDDRLARARLAAARAQLAQARARHGLARRGPRGEDLAAARADAAAAAVAAAHRTTEQTRSEHLGARGAVATSIVEADGAAARVAAAQAEAADARFRSLAKGTRPELISEAEAAVALAQADVDAATVALDQTVLRAPADGIVLRRFAEVGALVSQLTPAPVVSVADVRDLEIRAEIDEADIGAVQVGQIASVTATAYGAQRFPVRITRVTRELGRKTVRDDDPRARIDTRVLEVIARFEGDPPAQLPLGLRVTLHVGK